jgi:membrane-bound lytic murein transglycosylase D
MRARWIAWIAVGALASAAEAPQQQQQPVDPDELYELGQQMFDTFAPPEVKEQYAFPTREQWDQFAGRLERALDGDSLEGLAALGPEARAALDASGTLPGYTDYADWLETRIDEIEGARLAVAHPAPPAAAPPAQGPRPSAIPYYGLWLSRERGRPVPPRAASLMPALRAAFAAEGVPPELAWIAEAESTLNPGARSPSGAAGLFQLTPDTAHALGLSTFLPDDRTNPEKSARAAARLLAQLHARFGSWPLALAAYNAGEGRLSRLLASKGAHDFAGISGSLPAETRMYVPKVCALVKVRTGLSLEEPAAPAA